MKLRLCLVILIIALAAPFVVNAGALADITIIVDGNLVSSDTQPVIQNGRTLVPIRPICEALGCEVTWDPILRTANIWNEETSIAIKIGSNIIKKTTLIGSTTQDIAIDVPATIINQRTMVPVRAVSEAFGADVEWLPGSRQVVIESKNKPASNVQEGFAVGDRAPEITFKTPDGKQAKLSDYKGKVVFLNFWASWCGPCVGEMPAMQKVHEKYGDKLQIIAVNSGEDADTVKDFIDSEGFTFSVALDEDNSISTRYGLEFIPISYVLNKDGVITKIFGGASTEEDMTAAIDKAMK